MPQKVNLDSDYDHQGHVRHAQHGRRSTRKTWALSNLFDPPKPTNRCNLRVYPERTKLHPYSSHMTNSSHITNQASQRPKLDRFGLQVSDHGHSPSETLTQVKYGTLAFSSSRKLLVRGLTASDARCFISSSRRSAFRRLSLE